MVTPDHLHKRHAEICLQAGCHILMTKPIATNLTDGRAIVQAAEKFGKTLMIAHERRFRSNYRELKRLLESGTTGRVVKPDSEV